MVRVLPGAISLLLALTTGIAAAQPPHKFAAQTEASARYGRVAEHNMMGLIQYCRNLGLVGDDAVIAQRNVVVALPGPKDEGEAEETEGRRGMIAVVQVQVSLEQSAQAQGMTMAAKCEQMALSLPR